MGMNHDANNVGEELSMKRFSFLLVMLAMALALGLAFMSCGGDDGDNNTPGGNTPGNGGGDDNIGLHYWDAEGWGTYVEVTINGISSPKNLSKGDFALTINGTSATISIVENEVIGGNLIIYIYFTNPVVTVGTSCTITVVYSGSAIAPFTQSGTATCTLYQ